MGETLHPPSKITFLLLSESHPGVFMQVTPAATAFTHLRLNLFVDHVHEITMMNDSLMLKTVSVSHLCPLTEVICLGPVLYSVTSLESQGWD